MANTFKFGNGEWAVGKETALAYNDENSNFKPLPFTFDRASTATVVNKQGLIETVGVDEPRIDFLNNTKGHLLLEPQRQNKIPYSEDFSGWNSYQVTSNTTISPSGSTVYFLDFEDVRMFPTTSISNSTTYTSSIYLKANKVANVKIRNARDQDTVISLTTDWVRYEVTAISHSSSTNALLIDARFSQGLGASGLEIALWGAQLEEGSYATSYIPTQGETNGVTRSAETCNGAGNSNVFNDSEGVLYAEIFKELNQSTTTAIGFSVSSGRLKIYITSSGKLEVQLTPSSGDSVNFYNNSIDLSIFNKVAFRYNSNGENSLFLNGVKIATTTGVSFSPSTLNSLNFDFGNGSEDFYGNVKDIKVYNTALTDAELIALTS